MTNPEDKRPFDIDLPFTGREIVVLRRRYEIASIANDLLIAAWFLIGSILFFQADTTRAGTWMFVIGSAQMAVRPAIRLSRRIHLAQRAQSAQSAQGRHDSDDDY